MFKIVFWSNLFSLDKFWSFLSNKPQPLTCVLALHLHVLVVMATCLGMQGLTISTWPQLVSPKPVNSIVLPLESK